ncbi:MAG: DEAD/DEAH box helicase [Lautropia mirabilis]|nr:DEAD/DEAH box helicase [Lautropia mirabilis]
MTLSTAPAPEGAQEPATVTFSDFGLHPDVLKAVTAAGYTKPTPIQAKAIPVVMAGHDVMAAAQTGTGKTAGFALPIINALMPSASHSASPARHPVRALIIAPTRELADQIHDNVKTYIQFTPLRSAAVFGGVDMQPQTNALRAGVEILIATPGRLLDHVQQKSVNLSQVQLLVLDEADRMLDMGFLPDIQRIINLLNPRRQNLMFSATFSDEIRKLAKRFLNEPKLIEVARPNTLAENVEQTVYHVPSEDLKRDAVGALIRERGIEQVIVFSNTKIGAGRLARHLQKEGFLAEAIHGDKSQQERLKTLDGFKAGEIKVLVATDVAARGLDIAELPAVINYDLPHSPEDYVHRIGRTGRAGASGMALSLMVDHDQKALAEIEKLTKRKLDVQELQLPASAHGRGERRSRDDRRGHRDGGEAAARSEDSRGIGAPSRSGRDRGSRREGNLRGHAPSAERAARYPAPQPVVDDPLFHAPYVPSEPAAADAPERGRVSAPGGASTDTPAVIQGGAPAAASGCRGSAPSSAIRRPANKLAVLLGGKPGG